MDVSDIDGAVPANGKIMTPIDLAVIIAEAAPLGEDLAGEVEFEDLTAIRRSWFEVASIDHVEEVVWADGQ